MDVIIVACIILRSRLNNETEILTLILKNSIKMHAPMIASLFSQQIFLILCYNVMLISV